MCSADACVHARRAIYGGARGPVFGIKDAAACGMSSAAAKRRREPETRKKANTYSDIALITYESCEPSFFSCVCDDISEHACNLGIKKTLHTYVCALGAAWRDNDTERYYDGHELIPRQHFRKTLVEQTSELKNIHCDLMVILCHGSEGNAVTIPHMSFFDDKDDIPFSKNS